jgi:hypothetical protein
MTMMKTFLALGAAAVALTAAPAAAEKHYSNLSTCTKWSNGECVKWQTLTRGAANRLYKTGYVFGPTYTYTEFSAVPQPFVTTYKLSPDSRYVYSDGYLYVVDPNTYAVTHVYMTPPR